MPEVTYDVIIIGAGINGCGIALELAKKGRRVLILDKGEIGGGTSSRSSRLIHGGLRYLETFRFRLVYQALHDRQELLETYPDLVNLRPFYLPVYQTSPRSSWMIWTGVKLYDFLAGRRNPGRSRFVMKEVFQEIFPAVRQDGLKRVLRYYDGKTNDLELTKRVAKDAQKFGGKFLEGQVVKCFEWDPEKVKVKTETGIFQSQNVVNATGPWIDEFVAQFKLPARYQIRKVSGIHLFLDRLLVPEPMFLQTSGKRILFIIPEPENGQTILGTTEREEKSGVDKVEVQEADIAYLLREVNAYLMKEAHVQREEVRDVVIGIRPLIARDIGSTDLSREYELDLHRNGKTQLLHVFGGKLTTYLSLSRQVVKMLGMK